LIVEWTKRARRERRDAFHYLFVEAGSLQAAMRIDAEFDTRLGLLAQYPDAGRQGRVPGTRELVIADTPYLVAYRVKADRVLILRLFHHAQRWPKRL
jgi:toxin ParE1/3/4